MGLLLVCCADVSSWAVDDELGCVDVLGLVEGGGSDMGHLCLARELSWGLVSRLILDFAALTNEVCVSMPTRMRSTSMFRTLQAQLYD